MGWWFIVKEGKNNVKFIINRHKNQGMFNCFYKNEWRLTLLFHGDTCLDTNVIMVEIFM